MISATVPARVRSTASRKEASATASTDYARRCSSGSGLLDAIIARRSMAESNAERSSGENWEDSPDVARNERAVAKHLVNVRHVIPVGRRSSPTCRSARQRRTLQPFPRELEVSSARNSGWPAPRLPRRGQNEIRDSAARLRQCAEHSNTKVRRSSDSAAVTVGRATRFSYEIAARRGGSRPSTRTAAGFDRAVAESSPESATSTVGS